MANMMWSFNSLHMDKIYISASDVEEHSLTVRRMRKFSVTRLTKTVHFDTYCATNGIT